MKVRLRIDGIDRSGLLPRTGWTLEDSEGKRISTLSLSLEDRTGAVAASALELKELILDDPDAPTTRYFLGIVTLVDTRPLEGVGLRHDVVCQEYGWLMEHYFHTEKYANQNDSAIIADAFADVGLTEIDAVTLVQTGRLIEKFVMNNMSLRAMMDALAEITGFIWYVDWQKRLVYQSSQTSVSDYTLTDAPSASMLSDKPYRNLARTRDYTGMVNYVVIRGGFFLSPAKEVILGSNAQDKVVISGDISTGPSETQALPDIWINTGTDGTPVWTTKTVGSKAAGHLLASYDCLFNWIDRTLEFNTAPPNLTKSYKLNGRAQQAYKFEIPEQAGLDLAGRKLAMVINDEDIRTDQQAYDKAQAIFREKAIAREKTTLTVTQDGLRSGQLIKVINAKMGIDKFYSIRRVVTRFLGGTLASHELTLTNPAKVNPDVLDMIAAGWRASHPVIPYRDSEMLVVFLSHTETALSLAEEVLEAFGTSKTHRVMANPVSIWPFEEGQGTLGDDRYGSNDLTLTGAPTWAQGKKGYAIQLNGTTQYGKKTTAASLPSAAITIAGWIKLDALANWRVIASHDKDAEGGWGLNVDADGSLNFTVKSGVAFYSATKAGIAISTWFHVVGVYDGANVKVYVDGVVGTDAALVGATLDSAGDLYVGVDSDVGNFFDGLLDELWLFPVAISAASVGYLRDFKEIYAGFWKVAA